MKGNYTYYLKGVADRGSEQIQNPETDFYFLQNEPDRSLFLPTSLHKTFLLPLKKRYVCIVYLEKLILEPEGVIN
jgi:hypothetical protein